MSGEPLEVRDEASVAVVRERVREVAGWVGLSDTAREELVVAASELAHNLHRHARRGTVTVRAVHRPGCAGVEVVAVDRGRGIADPTSAVRGTGVSASGLGVGLAGVHRLCHEIDVEVRWGEGTRIAARRWVEPPPWSPGLALLGRALVGERISGDAGYVHRFEDGFLVAVADGLGHGPDARRAADAVLEPVRQDPGRPLEVLLERASEAAGATRGAAMSLARWFAPDGRLRAAGVGNVSVRGRGLGRAWRLPTDAGVLGPRHRAPQRLRVHEFALQRGQVLVVATDGLQNRHELFPDRASLAAPPMVTAHRLVADHGRTHDDTLVVVAR